MDSLSARWLGCFIEFLKIHLVIWEREREKGRDDEEKEKEKTF
jgi:hypothetical protein